MKSAQDWLNCDLTDPLDRSPQWRILLEEPMRARLIVISSMRKEHAAKVAFAKSSDVVQAFAAKRANQSFGYTILPG